MENTHVRRDGTTRAINKAISSGDLDSAFMLLKDKKGYHAWKVDWCNQRVTTKVFERVNKQTRLFDDFVFAYDVALGARNRCRYDLLAWLIEKHPGEDWSKNHNELFDSLHQDLDELAARQRRDCRAGNPNKQGDLDGAARCVRLLVSNGCVLRQLYETNHRLHHDRQPF